MKRFFMPGDTVLFQGDSITDNCREEFENRFGYGYPEKVRNIYDALFSNDNDEEGHEAFPPDAAGSKVNFVNRGISGNKVQDLIDRYEKDFLEIKPDFISILIGVNDIGHHYSFGAPVVTPEMFEEQYSLLLSKIKNDMPKTKIMLMAPFVFENCTTYEGVHKDLLNYWPVVEKLAEKYADYYIPLHKIFAKELETHAPQELARDGVHPTPYAHSIIAREYLKALSITE